MLRSAAEQAVPFIPLVIGQATGDGATEIGRWLLGAAAVAVAVHQILGVVEKVRKLSGWKHDATDNVHGGKGIDPEVCRLKHEDIDGRITQIQTLIQDSQKQTRIDMKGIHERINKVAESMAELTGVVKSKL